MSACTPGAYRVRRLIDTHPPHLASTIAAKQAAIVAGKAFNRFVTIWLENTDFDDALADREHHAS
jgi:hypothetical protein